MAQTICSETIPIVYLASPKLIKLLNLPKEEQIICAKTTDESFPNGVSLTFLAKKYKSFFSGIMDTAQQFINDDWAKLKKPGTPPKVNTKTLFLACSNESPIPNIPSDLLISIKNGRTFQHRTSPKYKVRIAEVIRPFEPDEIANKKFDYVLGCYEYSEDAGIPFYKQIPLNESFLTYIDLTTSSWVALHTFINMESEMLVSDFPIGSFASFTTQKIVLQQEKVPMQTTNLPHVEHYALPDAGDTNIYEGKIISHLTSAKRAYVELLVITGPQQGQKVVRDISEIEAASPHLPPTLEKELETIVLAKFENACIDLIYENASSTFRINLIKNGSAPILVQDVNSTFGMDVGPDKLKSYAVLLAKSINSHQLIKKGQSEISESPYIWFINSVNNEPQVDNLVGRFKPDVHNLKGENSVSIFIDSFISNKLTAYTGIWEPVLNEILKKHNIANYFDSNVGYAIGGIYIKLPALLSVRYELSIFENKDYMNKKLKRLKANLQTLPNIHQYNKMLVEKWLGPS